MSKQSALFPPWLKTGLVGAVCLIVGMVVAASFTMMQRRAQANKIKALEGTISNLKGQIAANEEAASVEQDAFASAMKLLEGRFGRVLADVQDREHQIAELRRERNSLKAELSSAQQELALARAGQQPRPEAAAERALPQQPGGDDTIRYTPAGFRGSEQVRTVGSRPRSWR